MLIVFSALFLYFRCIVSLNFVQIPSLQRFYNNEKMSSKSALFSFLQQSGIHLFVLFGFLEENPLQVCVEFGNWSWRPVLDTSMRYPTLLSMACKGVLASIVDSCWRFYWTCLHTVSILYLFIRLEALAWLFGVSRAWDILPRPTPYLYRSYVLLCNIV